MKVAFLRNLVLKLMAGMSQTSICLDIINTICTMASLPDYVDEVLRDIGWIDLLVFDRSDNLFLQVHLLWGGDDDYDQSGQSTGLAETNCKKI